MAKFILSGDDLYESNPENLKLNGIPSDTYTATYNSNNDTAMIESVPLHSDSLVDLPTTEYLGILNEVQLFFTPETKKKFDDFGFIYKKSILLHGAPGNGKTCLVVRIANEFLDTFHNGVVLFNPHFMAAKKLQKVVPEHIPLLVILEEFDSVCEKYSEDFLLSVFDGELQRPNTFYILTTNFINQINKRLLRPGRISNIVEVKSPNLEARTFYLQNKVSALSDTEVSTIAQAPEGFSLDDLKSVVLSTQCLNIPLNISIDQVKKHQQYVSKYNDDEDDDFDTQQEKMNKKLKALQRVLGGMGR